MYQQGTVKNFESVRYKQEPDFKLPPQWAAQAIFYQIFPDRFCNGDSKNDPPWKVPWHSQPDYYNFFGGDLKGIIKQIPYLKRIGITAVYLNPIFDSPSNHKYDTRNYLKIAPEFGDIATFKSLIKKLHQAGIRIIIDGVFNHTGDSFCAFQDILKNGHDSRFKDWYHCYGFPTVQGCSPNYECWWNFGSLPKLNHYNPEVVRYLLSVVAFWTSLGIDGWRLDVPNEVHMDFWRDFRKLVKAINPEAFIVGEIWDDPSPWLTGDTCDAVMNYRWREAVIRYFVNNQTSVGEFRHELTCLRNNLPLDHQLSAYNLLSSHDTPRFLTVCGEDKRKFLCAVAFQFLYLGIPSLYYGDELGITGDKDPDCRKSMPWEEQRQDATILNNLRQLSSLRKDYPSLTMGSYYDLYVGEGIYGFIRISKEQQVLACFNPSESCRQIILPPEWQKGWQPIYAIASGLASPDYPEIPPYGVRVFVR